LFPTWSSLLSLHDALPIETRLSRQHWLDDGPVHRGIEPRRLFRGRLYEPMRLAFDGDWQPALAVWFTPAIVAAVVWRVQSHGITAPKRRLRPSHRLYRDPLAWQVTAYMGLQSSLAYTVFGWLPTILADRGMDPVAAGAALSVSIMIQVITAIAAPTMGVRMRDQRAMITVMVVLTFIGLMGCVYAPIAGVWAWV